MRAALHAAVGLVVGNLLGAAAAPADYTIQLDVIRAGYDGVHCWVHPRAGIVPLLTLTPDAPETIAAGKIRTYELYLGDDLRAGKLAARLQLRVTGTAGKTPGVRWDDAPVSIVANDGRT